MYNLDKYFIFQLKLKLLCCSYFSKKKICSKNIILQNET
jgi:hypothetical protein